MAFQSSLKICVQEEKNSLELRPQLKENDTFLAVHVLKASVIEIGKVFTENKNSRFVVNT